MVKTGINYMETKPNMVKEARNPPISKNKIYKVKKIEKPQASKSKRDKYIIN